jgi:hypothetical protein
MAAPNLMRSRVLPGRYFQNQPPLAGWRRGAVVEGDELVVAKGFHPAFNQHRGVHRFRTKNLGNFRTLHTLIKVIFLIGMIKRADIQPPKAAQR